MCIGFFFCPDGKWTVFNCVDKRSFPGQSVSLFTLLFTVYNQISWELSYNKVFCFVSL